MTMRAFIIHGWNSGPDAAWKPWLKKKLEEQGFDAYAPRMPTPLRPECSEWVQKIEETVGTPDGDCFFIGHSLGCAAILRYLEKINTMVGGAVLAAGPSNGMNFPFIKSFFRKGFDWKKIKSSCRKFVIIHSENDRIVPIKHAYVLKQALDAELIVDRRGHFMKLDEFETLLDAVKRISTY